jgi:predicted ArsR family transcriptional regulator
MTSTSDRLWTTTRGQLVQLLRRGPRTVNELAAELSLTDNAVRAQLASLERDGLVRLSGQRPGARRPNFIYELTEAADRLFPKPYDAVLSELLSVLKQHVRPAARQKLLREVGRRLAQAHAPRLRQLPVRERLQAAIEILSQLGGLAELHSADSQYEIRGCSCPLSAVVRSDPDACIVAEAMLAELTGMPVRESCEKGPSPRCRFIIETTVAP